MKKIIISILLLVGANVFAATDKDQFYVLDYLLNKHAELYEKMGYPNLYNAALDDNLDRLRELRTSCGNDDYNCKLLIQKQFINKKINKVLSISAYQFMKDLNFELILSSANRDGIRKFETYKNINGIRVGLLYNCDKACYLIDIM